MKCCVHLFFPLCPSNIFSYPRTAWSPLLMCYAIFVNHICLLNYYSLDTFTHKITFWVFCSSESVRWPTVRKYKVDVASLESLALPELQVSSCELWNIKDHINVCLLACMIVFLKFVLDWSRCRRKYAVYFLLNQVKEETDLFIIDEVGKMELFSSAFFPAVMRVLESNIPVLATIPIPRHGRDIPGGTILSDSATSLRLLMLFRSRSCIRYHFLDCVFTANSFICIWEPDFITL